jgi:hypothetical protein
MIVVLVGTGRAKGDTITGTSDSIQFHTRRTGVSDVTTGHSNISRRRGTRRHAQSDMDLDLDNPPTSRAVALPGGDNWPLGNKGHSLDVTFSEQGDETSRSSAALGTEKGRSGEHHRGRENPPQRAGRSPSALDAAV